MLRFPGNQDWAGLAVGQHQLSQPEIDAALELFAFAMARKAMGFENGTNIALEGGQRSLRTQRPGERAAEKETGNQPPARKATPIPTQAARYGLPKLQPEEHSSIGDGVHRRQLLSSPGTLGND